MRYAIIFLLPLTLRLILGVFIPPNRDYDTVNIGLLVADPSFLTFLLCGFIVVVNGINNPESLEHLIRAPLCLFTLYVALGMFFSLGTSQYALGLFVCYELLVCFSIISICLHGALSGGSHVLLKIENGYFAIVLLMLGSAYLDLLLPGTRPFAEDGSGRFYGHTFRLVAVQWAAIASVALLIALTRFFAAQRLSIFYLLLSSLSLVILVLTGTRGALVACGVGILASFFVAARSNPEGKARNNALIMVLSFAAVLYLFFEGSSQIATSLRLDDDDNLSTLSGRSVYWEQALHVLLQNPLVD